MPENDIEIKAMELEVYQFPSELVYEEGFSAESESDSGDDSDDNDDDDYTAKQEVFRVSLSFPRMVSATKISV